LEFAVYLLWILEIWIGYQNQNHIVMDSQIKLYCTYLLDLLF
jgi:hypothetical protein